MKHQFELIERYIDGDLNAEETKTVEQLIASDPDFKNEYNLRLNVNKAIGEKDIMELRYKLSMIHRQETSHSIGIIRHLFEKKWHLVAASITILAIIGSFLLNNLNNQGSDQLFEKYYSSENAVFTTRSGENPENSDLTVGLQKFQKQNYNEAINLLKKNRDNVVSQYYLGISYIETKQFTEAKAAFHYILEQESNLFTEQAQWYKGLCLLKLDQLEDAKQLFTDIINSNSIYNNNASEILKKLN